jgi:hypothetical protein
MVVENAGHTVIRLTLCLVKQMAPANESEVERRPFIDAAHQNSNKKHPSCAERNRAVTGKYPESVSPPLAVKDPGVFLRQAHHLPMVFGIN